MDLPRAKAVVLPLVVTCCSCIAHSKTPIDATIAAALKSETVAYAARKKPDFWMYTYQNSQGPLWLLAVTAEGNEVVTKNNIPDPAEAIAAAVTKTLGDSYGARPAPSPISVGGEDDAAKLAALAGGTARFVVDVKTEKWAAYFFPSNFSHYRIIYIASARLVDVQTQKVVAEGGCKRVPESDVNAPTYDELLKNGAWLLKEELKGATAECFSTLKVEMLSLPAAAPGPHGQ